MRFQRAPSWSPSLSQDSKNCPWLSPPFLTCFPFPSWSPSLSQDSKNCPRLSPPFLTCFPFPSWSPRRSPSLSQDLKNGPRLSCPFSFCFLFINCRPNLFDYDALLKLDPEARLDHAFRVAHEEFRVHKYLEPEGTWFLCYYQADATTRLFV